MILHKETIINNLSKAQAFKNILTSNEIEDIWKLAFSNNSVRKNPLGNIFISGNCVKAAYELIKHKIPINAKLYSGNFFICTTPYGIHLDSFNQKEEKDDGTTIYKNVLIPLWIGGCNDGGKVIFFDQRLVDYGCAFNKGGPTSYKESRYQVYNDYLDLQFYDGNRQKIDKKLNNVPFNSLYHLLYFNHINQERLEGFTAESFLDWKPGNILVFDAIQVHASAYGEKKWKNKMGLLLRFKVDI